MSDCEACDTGGKLRPEPKRKPPIFCEHCKARLNQQTPERCPECGEPTKKNDRLAEFFQTEVTE